MATTNITAATAPSTTVLRRDGRPFALRPGFAAGGVVLLVTAIVLHIWVVQPHARGAGRAVSLAVILLIAAALHRLTGSGRRDVGLRLDTLAPAARLVIPPTLLAGAALILFGAALGTLRFPPNVLAGFALYPIWGLVQQYALQGLVLLGLEAAGAGSRAPVLAAGLFALVHLPNPLLTAVTFLAGWAWCEAFRRRPNLLVLALSHGWLAVTLFASLPLPLTGQLRIGPDYLRVMGLL
ncbi:MAG TPA: CPBP family glutamic-type intramembrane protease [Longimicrobiales bacterium]|nr:CPBP family glutamic-type intramembrane protease [Longimicrobiales bacterium]